MKVEILTFEGCPNHAPALEMVRRVLDREKQVVEVLVFRRGRHVAVVVAGPLGEAAQPGFPGGIGEQAAGRNRAAHHLESDADAVVDVRDIVSCERVKARVAPRFHPVDQLVGHHPFFDKQGENVCLKPFP